MLDSRILTRVFWASQVALVVKNPPANAEDVIDAGSIPGSGRSPGGGRGSPFQWMEFSRARILKWYAISVCVCARARAHSPGSSEWKSRGKNTAVFCHFRARVRAHACVLSRLLRMEFSRQEYCSDLPFLLQGIFPTQGLVPHLLCLLHCRQIF